MRTRADIVAAARSFIPTPFHHQGRAKGLGIDCIGLTWGALVEAGFDITVPVYNYPKIAVDFRLHEKLAEHLDAIPTEQAREGDVLSFVFKGSKPQHVGILSRYYLGGFGLVHCWTGAGKAGEHSLSLSWRNRTVGAWRPRGLVENGA